MIIADAHKGQAIGLGSFLHERYPSMTIEEHLQHIYKLCIIHYKRNINNLRNVPDEIKNVMKVIPNCKTQAEVKEAFNY
ncbi:hypothetical protein RhiirA4_491253 [Rhizophagus irregularis]|uniref:Uncharacterized protein n=1 Tax=Rhizophagus irregularis TaxID=588596 RepID=A0A2I1HWA9_9GLOM|nr:hypothetical protein RhiirA4_491253 [Rhizophagus irregularis]